MLHNWFKKYRNRYCSVSRAGQEPLRRKQWMFYTGNEVNNWVQVCSKRFWLIGSGYFTIWCYEHAMGGAQASEDDHQSWWNGVCTSRCRPTASSHMQVISFKQHLGVLSAPEGNRLTWFLCGGVDGCGLRPGASCVESSHGEVVHRVRSQPCDVNKRVVSRNTHFSNSVRLGVVLPIHDLLGRKTSAHFTALLKFLFLNGVWNAVCITEKEEVMNNKFSYWCSCILAITPVMLKKHISASKVQRCIEKQNGVVEKRMCKFYINLLSIFKNRPFPHKTQFTTLQNMQLFVSLQAIIQQLMPQVRWYLIKQTNLPPALGHLQYLCVVY